MNQNGSVKANFLFVAGLGLVATVAFGLWLASSSAKPLALRVPGTDRAPGSEGGEGGNPVLAGRLTRGDGQPGKLPGNWPQFRGPNRDNLEAGSSGLLRT